MEDWDVLLEDAIPAAQKAAATPLTSAMLDLCSCDKQLPFSGSWTAMARLLDIAILTANQKAAVNLSKKSHLRPLRRWGLEWYRQDCWKAARTALWAGADFQDLMVKENFFRKTEDVPFPQALFLESKLEDWQEIRHLLPGCCCYGLWRPRNLDNRFGIRFLDGLKLSLNKIRAAEDAGLDLQFFSVVDGGAFLTLLDMAILCGQPDCAKACVDGGIELKGDGITLALHKRVLRGESLSLQVRALNVVPSETQIAAAAAGCACLKRSWKSESSQKGIVLHQMFKGRLSLVQAILSFSMPVPKIIGQLDLWERVGDWIATICGGPASVHAAADCNAANVEDPEGVQDNGKAGALLYIEVLVLFFLVCFQDLPRIKMELVGTIPSKHDVLLTFNACCD